MKELQQICTEDGDEIFRVNVLKTDAVKDEPQSYSIDSSRLTSKEIKK